MPDRVELDGLSELQNAVARIKEIPWEITKKALEAMGGITATRIRETGEAMGVRDPESGEHILDHVNHTKPLQTEDGGKSFLVIKGSRKRGNTVTRNAAIAYVNEYGAPQRGIRARPFILRAMTAHEDEIIAAADEIIGGFIENTYGNG